jgi:hypothetical protein
MARLSDIKFSQEGEVAEKQGIATLSREEIIESAPFENQSKRVIFKLVDERRNGRLWFPAMENNVYNPKTKKREKIRLIRGVPSIWESEQNDIPAANDKDYLSKNLISVCFEDNRCMLDKDMENLTIERLKYSNSNINNPNRISGARFEFYEWNPAAQEEAALKQEMLEMEAMQLAMEQSVEKAKKHGLFLNIRNFLVDELGEQRTDKGIKTLYVREAKRNPKRFKETFGSKEVEVNYLIKRAILDAKIDVGGANGDIRWSNGGIICKKPQSRQAAEYLLEFAMLPTDEGKEFVKTLEKISA